MITSGGISRSGAAAGIVVSKDNLLSIASPNMTAVYQNSDAVNVINMATLTFYVNVTLGTATYVDVKLQYSPDGTNWYDDEIPSALPSGEVTSTTAYRRYTASSTVKVKVESQDHYVRVCARADAGGTTAAIVVHLRAGGATDVTDLTGGITTISGTADVNLLEVAGTATAVDAGASNAGTQRVINANDDPGVVSLAVIAGDTTSIDGKIPADPAREGGNLSTIAGDTTSLDTKVPADPAREGGNLATVAARLLNGGNSAADILNSLLSVAGVTTGAKVVTDVAGTIQQYLRGIVDLLGSGITVSSNIAPQVANAPASPGQITDCTVNTELELTLADLTPGVTYKVTVMPWDLSVAPGTPTDFIRGVIKCDTAAGGITDLDDGDPILSNSPYLICLPDSSTKVRVYFMRDSETPIDCKIYLSAYSA